MQHELDQFAEAEAGLSGLPLDWAELGAQIIDAAGRLAALHRAAAAGAVGAPLLDALRGAQEEGQ